MENNRKWLEVAEYISIIGSAVGAGLAVILEHVAYVAAPVSLALLLNLLNRQKLEQQYGQSNSPETSLVTQQLSEDIEALRSSILAMAADVAFNRIEESIEELSAEITINQTRLQDRMDGLEAIDIDRIQAEIGQLRNQSSYLLESIANILQRLEHLPATEKIDSAESRLTRMITEMTTAESMHLEAMRSDIEQLRSQGDRLQSSLETVKHRLENGTSSSSNYPQSDLSHLAERITALQTEMQTSFADLNIESLQTTSSQLDAMGEKIAQLSAESANLLQNIVNVTQRLENLPLPSSSVTPEIFASAIAKFDKKINQLHRDLQQREETQSPNREPIIAEISQLKNQYAAWESRGLGESEREQESQWLRSQMESLKNQYDALQSSVSSLQGKTPASKAPESSSLSDKAEKWLGNMLQGIEGRKPSKSTPEIEAPSDDDFFDDAAPSDDDLFDDEDRGAVAPATPSSTDENREWKCVHTLTGSASVVRSIALNPDGKTLVSGDYEAIGVWDVSTGQLRQTLKLDAAEISVSAIALSPDGKTVVGATGEIEIWDLGTGKGVGTLETEDWTTVVAIGPDGQKMAIGGADPLDQNGSVQLWNFATGELIRTCYCVEREIYALAFSADGQMLAVGGGNPEKEKGILQLWHVNSDKPLCNLEPAVTVYAVAITADGQMLVGGCGDNTIKIWNPATSGLVQTLSGHAGKVYAIAISPDGKLLASGSGDEKIKIWNLETGEIVDTLSGHTGGVRTIAFSSDGKTLVSGAQDMTMKIWQRCRKGSTSSGGFVTRGAGAHRREG
ncbi:MAG: hypothetical protein GDA48_11015 [Hormoscilla sp. GM102CHS1]|nr:hypothetical protein [Hormoscilla sp. GM102CHS1]